MTFHEYLKNPSAECIAECEKADKWREKDDARRADEMMTYINYEDYHNGINRGSHGFIICPFCEVEMVNNECSKCGYHQQEIESFENEEQTRNEIDNECLTCKRDPSKCHECETMKEIEELNKMEV